MPLVLVNKARKARPPTRAPGELLAEKFEPKMRTAFTDNIAGLLSDAKVEDLAAAIADQDMSAALQIIPATGDKRSNWDKMRRQFADNYAAIVERAGHQAVAEGDLGFTFDIDQKDVVAWIDAKAATLVTNVSADTKASIKDVVRRGSLNGLTIDQQARLIRPMVGLTDRHAAAVQNRLQLHLNDGMSEERATELASAYAGDLLSMRAEMIARTETITAANQGKLASFNQAREQGLLGDNPTKKWVGSELESTEHGACEECARLNASDPIPMDEMFDGGDYDDVAAPPLHPNCRCTLSFDAGFGDAE